MRYVSKMYITEEQILSKFGFDEDFAAITGVEFNSDERTLYITARSSKNIENVTGNVSDGLPRRKKIDL
jgi:hypothetical protein